MIIFLEGPDCCGKSTQMFEIRKQYLSKKFLTMSFGYVTGAGKDYYFELFENAYKVFNSSDKTDFLCDRSPIGEAVYGTLYRNYSGDYVFDMERYWSHYSFFKNIYLITMYDTAENSLKRDDGCSLSTKLEMREKEIELFHRAHKKSRIKHKLLINIENKSVTDVTDEIIHFLGN